MENRISLQRTPLPLFFIPRMAHLYSRPRDVMREFPMMAATERNCEIREVVTSAEMVTFETFLRPADKTALAQPVEHKFVAPFAYAGPPFCSTDQARSKGRD